MRKILAAIFILSVVFVGVGEAANTPDTSWVGGNTTAVTKATGSAWSWYYSDTVTVKCPDTTVVNFGFTAYNVVVKNLEVAADSGDCYVWTNNCLGIMHTNTSARAYTKFLLGDGADLDVFYDYFGTSIIYLEGHKGGTADSSITVWIQAWK